jgi:predicted ArsR family transcriptional regulator
MIHQLEQLLKQQGPMTIDGMAKAMDMPTSALQGMLDLLITKGRIQSMSGSDHCGGCTSCEVHQQTSYKAAS